jgi:hypothetical protein
MQGWKKMRRRKGTMPMSSIITSRTVRAALPAVLLTLSLGLFQACGSSSGALGSSPDGGVIETGGALNVPGDGGSLNLGGNTAVGASGAATAAGGAKAGGGGATAAGGACMGANCGVIAAGTQPAGSTCTTPDVCASGRCEPVTGKPMEACLAACFSDGVACTRALDCCSTGCMNGKCGGECTVVGDPCKVDGECCSNVCMAGQCQVDMPNRDCRPTGEDCGKGSGSGCCNTCGKTGRCDFGPDTCFAQGVACTDTAQCCHGACTGGKCVTACVAQAGACTANADCCSVDCVGGKCQPPPTVTTGAGGASGVGGATGVGGGPVACTLTGDACTTSAACCSLSCFGGFCESPVR